MEIVDFQVLEEIIPLTLNPNPIVDSTEIIELEKIKNRSPYPNPIHNKLYFNVNKENIISLYFYNDVLELIDYEITKIKYNLVEINLK